MISDKIRNKQNQNIANLYFFNQYSLGFSTKSAFVKQFSNQINQTEVGFAGFAEPKFLEQLLENALFDSNFKGKLVEKYNFDENKIMEIFDSNLNLCHTYLSISELTHVFLFPTFSSFVKQKMGGSSGFCPWKNTIIIYLNPQNPNWYEFLPKTIVHEYNHAIVRNFYPWESLLNSLVFEGLAEHFVEKILNTGHSDYVSAVLPEKCAYFFRELENKLESKDPNLEQEIFFSQSKYPFWLGYSLGYWMVDAFLQKYSKKNQKINWLEIIKTNPKEIASVYRNNL